MFSLLFGIQFFKVREEIFIVKRAVSRNEFPIMTVFGEIDPRFLVIVPNMVIFTLFTLRIDLDDASYTIDT